MDSIRYGSSIVVIAKGFYEGVRGTVVAFKNTDDWCPDAERKERSYLVSYDGRESWFRETDVDACL